jgi:GAF domain-containing protein
VANGNLGLMTHPEEWAEYLPHDEIYAFSQAFDSMTAQLKQTLEGMENQIEQRTVELELRSAYLRAGADVSQTISTILDPDRLIQEVVNIIRERFGLYYVGLFLLDEKKEWAILAAGTGAAGQALKSRRHRIHLGSGMIGWCIANQQPRIALEAGEDRVRLSTPELSDTRSEAALPLRSRGKVLGALTVQSTLPHAFNKDNIAVFQVMGDQVGIVLENARLYNESREALGTLQRLYGERTTRVWDEWLRKQNRLSVRSDELGVSPVQKQANLESIQAFPSGQTGRVDEADGPALSEGARPEGSPQGARPEGSPQGARPEGSPRGVAIPIKVRGRTIGVIETHKSAEDSPWTGREIDLLEHIADQLAVALEGAQLYEDTQRNAEYERIFSDITAKVRASTNINTIMQTAISELAVALRAPRGAIQLRITDGGDGDGGD